MFLRNDLGTDDLYTQVLALEQSMRDVFQQLRTPLNRARPINRLPPEILSAILRLAAGPIKTTDLRNVLRLSSVCRYWRAVILAHGAMWSTIRLTGQDPSFVVEQVKRCLGVPLHLTIDMPSPLFRVEGAPFLGRIKQITPIIRARRSQVRSISAVVGSCRFFRRDFGLDWPNLEELVWVDACQTGSRGHESPPVPDKDHRTPKLRYLSAKQGLAWGIASVTSLSTVKLEGPMDVDIFKFLQTTPQLESLELIKLDIHPTPTHATSLDLPRLTRLVMSNVEYGQLFVRVTFPSLNNLVIDPVKHQEPRIEIDWRKLQVPSAIITLKVEYLTRGPHDTISITGLDGAKIHSLGLMEHPAPTRSSPMILALCHASLASVTSLSIGRGVPEAGVQLPSIPICALISGLPNLWRLDLFPSQLTLPTVGYLCNHPFACPELKILSLAIVREICEEAFGLLSELVEDRANSELWLHQIDCVVLGAGGGPHETRRIWDSLSQDWEFDELLQCNCGVQVRLAWILPRPGCFTDLLFRCAAGNLPVHAYCREIPDGNCGIPQVLVSSSVPPTWWDLVGWPIRSGCGARTFFGTVSPPRAR